MGTAVKQANDRFLNLSVKRLKIKLLDEPNGYISAMAKNNVAHQMNYAVELLECELADAGAPHVLQLTFEGGDERIPERWTLHADGIMAASGTGDYVHNLLCQDAAAFKDLCREAVETLDLSAWTEREYQLLKAVRHIAAVEAVMPRA